MIEEARKPDAAALTAAEERAQKVLVKEKTAAIRSAAIKAKAADDEDIAILLDRFIAHDVDGNLYVLNKEGHPALDATGKPQTVDNFVKLYVDSKPHLQAGSGRTGAGSGTQNRGSDGKPTAPPKNMAEAKTAFAKLWGKESANPQ